MVQRNILSKISVIAVLGLGLAACTSTGGNTVTDTLDVAGSQQSEQSQTNPQNQQITEVQDPRAYCPKAVLRGGTEIYRLFKKGVNEGDPGAKANLRFQGNITEVVRECNYQGDSLNIRVGIKGRVINGPTSETGTFQMPVRIAVTQGTSVLYSELHQVNGTIPEGRSNGFFRFVDGNIFIPKPDKENIVVYAGYDEGPPA